MLCKMYLNVLLHDYDKLSLDFNSIIESSGVVWGIQPIWLSFSVSPSRNRVVCSRISRYKIKADILE